MLVTLKEILAAAEQNSVAVGAFNTTGLESLLAVLDAAQELHTPVIISHAQIHESILPMHVIGPIMLHFAQEASVPVCVHLDHGTSPEYCRQAMELGFTSIMFDASGLPYQENIALTRSVCDQAHARGVSVEAELGQLSVSEDGSSSADLFTDPFQAAEFVQETGVDALAVSFGTAHGIYHAAPCLDFQRVAEIRKQVPVPLVMHGGSGVCDSDYQQAIQSGIRKINYYTYMALAGADAVKEKLTQNSQSPVYFHDMAQWGYSGMKEQVLHVMRVFHHR